MSDFYLLLEGQEPREWQQHDKRFETVQQAVAAAKYLLTEGTDPESDDWICEVIVYSSETLPEDKGQRSVAIVNHHGVFLRDEPGHDV